MSYYFQTVKLQLILSNNPAGYFIFYKDMLIFMEKGRVCYEVFHMYMVSIMCVRKYFTVDDLSMYPR